MRRCVVVRPEPGNAATMARLLDAGLDALSCPLFAVVPVAWTPPDPSSVQALLLTSANAVRCAGPGLATLARLPVVAVGDATAALARRAGLDVVLTGTGSAQAAIGVAETLGLSRLLHLAGRDRVAASGVAAIVVVYASDPLPVAEATVAAWQDATILLHSARAARRVSTLAAGGRRTIDLIAISGAVLRAAGPGWRSGHAAAMPTDAAMVGLAIGAARTPPRLTDPAGTGISGS